MRASLLIRLLCLVLFLACCSQCTTTNGISSPASTTATTTTNIATTTPATTKSAPNFTTSVTIKTTTSMVKPGTTSIQSSTTSAKPSTTSAKSTTASPTSTVAATDPSTTMIKSTSLVTTPTPPTSSPVTTTTISSSSISSTTLKPTSPTSATTTNSTNNRGQTASHHGGIGGASSWADNIATALQALLKTAHSSDSVNGSLPVSIVSQLPGIFKGLQAMSSLKGQNDNDLARTLATLFGVPGSKEIPAWIHTIAKGDNSSQTMQNLANIVKMLSQQFPNNQLQSTLAKLLPGGLQLLSSLNLSSTSSPQNIVTALMKNPSAMAALSEAAKQLMGSMSQPGSTGLTSTLMNALQKQFPVNPSSQCSADLKTFALALQQGQMWALKMLDAMGKLSSGVLTGMTTLFGDYDECMDISYTNNFHTIEGLFSGMAIKAPAPIAARGVAVIGLHLCLPKSCTEGDIYGMINPSLEAIGSQYYGMYRYGPRSPSGDKRFLGVMITLGILVLLCIVGTVYGIFLDKYKREQEQYELHHVPTNGYVNTSFTMQEPGANKSHVTGGMTNGGVVNGDEAIRPPAYTVAVVENGHDGAVTGSGYNRSLTKVDAPGPPYEDGVGRKMLLSFSVLKNGKKLLTTDRARGDISCLHGIRVLSIVWVVLGHCFTQLGPAQGNSNASVVLLSQWTYMVFPGAFLGVDTFFLLSGLLTAFLFLRSTKKSGLKASSVIIYYIHRYWRLTPVYALLLAFYIGVYPYLKNGPFENLLGMDSQNSCRKYWQWNILYVNNVIPDKMRKMCFGWTWYLSNDMQFSFIAPLILIPWALRGSAQKAGRVFGWVLACALILTHIIASGVISVRNDFSIFKDTGNYMDKIYIVPWCRVGPYAVGLLLGFILNKTECKYRMSKLAVFVGWTLAWAIGLTLVYVMYDQVGDLKNGLGWNASQTAAYEALAKVLWGLCVGWVIFACCTGYGGPINRLLSWRAWAPLSRMTYGVYLIHIPVITTIVGNYKKPFYMDGWTGTELTLAVTVLSYMISFMASMLIESPTLGLEKAVLGKLLKKKH